MTEAAKRSTKGPRKPSMEASNDNLKYVPEEEKTTVMLRNLPNDYSRDDLLDLLNEQGFKGKYDFVYLPVDFKKNAGLGYAFVNMEKHEYAVKVFDHFKGFDTWKVSSPKVYE